jgi:hypothetical protein
MTPEFTFQAQFARTGCDGTITRERDGVELDLRNDEVLRLIDELAASPSKVDTLRNWFVAHYVPPKAAAEFAQIGSPRPSGDDWRL